MALEIRDSQLPGAGKGLYTTRPIKKGSKVIEYKGEIIKWKDYRRRVEEDKDGYLFFVDRNRCIDAYSTPQFKARYANDAAGLIRQKGLKNNCSYQLFGNKCYIVADRDIEAGEEIFVDYTREYWQSIRYNIRHKLYKERRNFYATV